MNKLVLVFVALAAVSVQTAVVPRDLVDEVNEQLDELENTVQGQTLVAHRNLGDAEVDFLTNSNNIVLNGDIAIQQEYESVLAQLNVILGLAASAGKDVSVCTDTREPLLISLAQDFAQRLRDNVAGINREEARIISRARYIVDTAINTVHRLQSQVESCDGNLLCLSPLVTDIELEKVRLPQNIRTEVDAAIGAITTLRLSVESAADGAVSQYTADSYAILHEITVCVNSILG